MKPSFTKHQETTQAANLFAEKPLIESREDYYKRVLKTLADALPAIDEKIKVTTDGLEKYKLEREFQNAELDIETTKNFYQHWRGRKNEYDAQYALMQAECTIHFGFVFEEAQKLAPIMPQLQAILKRWDAEKDKEKTPEFAKQEKMEFYMYLKKNIENHYEEKLKKEFKLPNTSNEEANAAPDQPVSGKLHKVE